MLQAVTSCLPGCVLKEEAGRWVCGVWKPQVSGRRAWPEQEGSGAQVDP